MNWNEVNFENPRNFLFCLQCTQREHVHNWNRRWAVFTFLKKSTDRFVNDDKKIKMKRPFKKMKVF